MFKREITDILIKWKNTPNHKPIIVKGVRQCGKTFSVCHFAEEQYENVVYIDFRENSKLISVFDGSLATNDLTVAISAFISQAKFVPYKTCIIFDEIQECPRARGALKFFQIDGRYDVICTGSLLGVNGYKTKEQIDREQKASIPVGYEQIVDMYPMNFKEWLWANGINDDVIDVLKKYFDTETVVPDGLHNRMRQLLLEYVIVGGMPEAVSTFITTHDVNQMRDVQRSIIDGYRTDMIKYASQSDKASIRECFNSIPKQLSKENKKFIYSQISSGGRGSKYQGSLQWIEDAGIIHRCYNLTIPELPLDGNSISDQFKVYMTDTGLFVSMLEQGTQADIISGNMLGYKGAIFENLMADFLCKRGRSLYYYHKDSGLELDFVIRYNGECVPIECKAVSGNAKSLKTVLKHTDKYHINNAIKLGDYNIGRNGPLLTIPFYMAMFI